MGELCVRLSVHQPDDPRGTGTIYIKSRWFPTHFTLWISDGVNAWTCEGSQEEVSRKAFSWDYTVAQYLDQAKQHLDHQHPECSYSFTLLPGGARKLSWTLEKDGVRLIANWKADKCSDAKKITCDILDCLIDGSTRLSEELQRKTRAFESMKSEAADLVSQNKKFRDLKVQFEEDIYKKFVTVLNSKKAKLRQLRDLALQVPSAMVNKGKEDAVENTESEDELGDSEEESADEGPKRMDSSESADVKADVSVPRGGGKSTRRGDDDREMSLPFLSPVLPTPHRIILKKFQP